jgi:hypothetical protein
MKQYTWCYISQQNNKTSHLHDVQYFRKVERMSSGYISLKEIKYRKTQFFRINVDTESSGYE